MSRRRPIQRQTGAPGEGYAGQQWVRGGERAAPIGPTEARRLLELLSVFGGCFDATTALEICRELGELTDGRLAVRRALQQGWVDIGARLVTGLSAECHVRERFEVGQWAEQLLEVGEIESHHLFADVLGTASIGDWVRARFDAGWARASRGLTVWRAGSGALAGPLAVGWMINAGVRSAADAAIAEELAAVLRAEDRLCFFHHWFQASRALLRSYAGDRDAAARLIGEMERLRAAQPSRLADCIPACAGWCSCSTTTLRSRRFWPRRPWDGPARSGRRGSWRRSPTIGRPP